MPTALLPTSIVVSPHARCDAGVVLAALRAGACGLLHCDDPNAPETRREREKLEALAPEGSTWGLRFDLRQDAGRLAILREALEDTPLPLVLLAGVPETLLDEAVRTMRRVAERVWLEVGDLASALEAERAGAAGLVLKGNEAGGWVGERSAFVLLQEVRERLGIPYWIQGGMGPETAAAAKLAGAQGPVFAEQLWLTEDAAAEAGEARALAALDGSESLCLGSAPACRLQGVAGRAALSELERRITAEASSPEDAHRFIREALASEDPARAVRPLGQDVAFAAEIARRFGSVGRFLTHVERTMRELPRQAAEQGALREGSALAEDHGTPYPICQGPMTRVSDVAPFGAAVADAGALPFLALALMRGPRVRELLEAARDQLAGKPWGVGVLGFVPGSLRREQLEIVREVKPSFALIAGGRPAQARELEDEGIRTYLHVPSPRLLRIFAEEGARRFVLEGRECGGHVGPLSSFALWQAAIDVVRSLPASVASKLHLVFAGGIHDEISAAMLATLAAPLVERGAKIGVLMGTAYLFTREAVESGAVLQRFQDEARECRETALLTSGLGYSVRCAVSPFTQEFESIKKSMIASGQPTESVIEELEHLNVGRLRIATKGVIRDESGLRDVGDAEQRDQGLYMIGDVALLRERVVTMRDLHESVSSGSSALLPQEARSAARAGATPGREPLAVVGVSALFPQAPDERAYWQNIVRGYSAIREVPKERWHSDAYFSPDRLARDRVYSKWGSFLEAIVFDPLKYSIPPAALASVEPVQLLALEIAARALDDAGYEREGFPRKRTSVFVAASGGHDLGSAYSFRTLMRQFLPKLEELDEGAREALYAAIESELPEWTEDTFPGVLMNVAAGRISNRLDLGGTNMAVDAACASSLAALQLAVDQLRTGHCDAALVASVDGTNGPFGFMAFSKTHALSPQGVARCFDQDADGIVMGEGVAAIVVKRLADAERDGDHIYAVIRGIGSSSDGRYTSLTAPSPEGQESALARAYDDAGVSPASVELVEAHATGTSVGDRGELKALHAFLSDAGSSEASTAVGSVKSMLGHTKASAGLASLVKAILALENRTLPPTIGVEQPNAQLKSPGCPLYVSTHARPWIRHVSSDARRSGVSAFGFGGTNFHCVLEEYTRGVHARRRRNLNPRSAELFYLDASSPQDLLGKVRALRGALDKLGTDLGQIAYASWLSYAGSTPGAARVAFVAGSQDELRTRLDKIESALASGTSKSTNDFFYSDDAPIDAASLCFVFPGQGSQQVEMLSELLLAFPELCDLYEAADAELIDELERPLSSLVFPPPSFDPEERKAQKARIDDTRVAQPALALSDVLVARLLERFGVEASMVAGHSFGEYVALWSAGVYPFDQLLRMAAARGRAIARAEEGGQGGMAAVIANETRTRALLEELELPLAVANLNAPEQTVVAGPVSAIDRAVEAMEERGVSCRRLPVSAAFHTQELASARDDLEPVFSEGRWAPPDRPVFSNTSAQRYPGEPVEIRELLLRHVSEPLRFTDEILAMHEAGARVFVEVGPKSALTGLIGRILADREHVAIATNRAPALAWRDFCGALAHLAALGLPLELEAAFQGRGLERVDIAALTRSEEARKEIKPTDWLVHPSLARPCLPTEKAEMTDDTRGGARPRIVLDAATEQHRGAPMAPPAPPQLNEEDSPEMWDQYQKLMSEWLDLQRQQARASERFLDLQARYLAHVTGQQPPADLATPAPSLEPRALDAPASSVAGPSSTGSLRVPPTPVLPALPGSDQTADAQAGTAQVRADAKSKPEETTPLLPATRAVETSAPASADEMPSTETFRQDLVQAVMDRTGYPEEMLELDRSLETDLGIDSIKLLEIFSVLKPYHPYLGSGSVEDEENVHLFARMKTLGDFVEAYDEKRRALASGEAPAAPAAPPALEAQPTPEAPAPRAVTGPVKRFVLKTIPVNGAVSARPFPNGETVVVLGDVADLTGPLVAALRHRGLRVRQVSEGKALRARSDGRFTANLASPRSVASLHDKITEGGAHRVGALINLLPLTERYASRDDLSSDDAGDLTLALFNVAKQVEEDLLACAGEGGGWMLNVTGLDGRFGLGAADALPVGHAGTIGLTKALAREWSAVRVKNLDLAPSLEPAERLAALLEEIFEREDRLEIGISPEGRCTLELEEGILPAENGAFVLDAESVVLATGGAGGITAEAVKALARAGKPRLVLVGRSPEPAPEPQELAALQDEAALRKHLLESMRAESVHVKPAEVEASLRRVLKERELRTNLAALREIFEEVDYVSLDVRDDVAFAKLIDSIYERHGRIDGVVHGAGVIEDKLLRDKEGDSFQRVFDTKVRAAMTLARCLRPEGLRFFVLFSSVSGRFGNAGQSDYGAANEVLNKLAARLDRAWQARVVSISWGPWNAGMMNENLRRIYESRGVGLVPVEEGATRFVEELGKGEPAEVVIACNVAEMAARGR